MNHFSVLRELIVYLFHAEFQCLHKGLNSCCHLSFNEGNERSFISYGYREIFRTIMCLNSCQILLKLEGSEFISEHHGEEDGIQSLTICHKASFP